MKGICPVFLLRSFSLDFFPFWMYTYMSFILVSNIIEQEYIMKKILIIEDDRVLSEELSKLLQSAGYEAARITEFRDVTAQMHNADADLILLDINLPGISGETLLQEFRRKSNTPVIMLTSRTAEIDEVLSMSCGADDYITKPYNPTILLLRISAVLKRAGTSGSTVQQYGEIAVSTVRGSLT